MNEQSTAFLEILSKCNPQDENLRKESLLQSIIHSMDYKELSTRKVFRPYFDQLFTTDKMRSYSETELSAASRAIPLIPTAVEDILFSIKNGAGPALKSVDNPDFMDVYSLNNVIEKLHDSRGKNYTNIAAEDFMSIFDDETVKTIEDDFERIPADCTDFSAAISEIYGGKKYCISDAEVRAEEAAYQLRVEELNALIHKSKGRRKRHRFLKAEVGMIALFIPTIVGGISGVISPTIVGGCTVVEMILAIIFWIWG